MRELLFPFPCSFECRLESEPMTNDEFANEAITSPYRSDGCLDSFLCCDRALFAYAVDHRSLLFGRAEDVSNGGIDSDTISRPAPLRFDLNEEILQFKVDRGQAVQRTQIAVRRDRLVRADN
jgi:hypothetical protein